ncbi:hypothetical protein O166_16865 [Pseudogulbenkiania ferrooxidans EGD-HP2]|uniref:Uncharacterized protein n=1 Tax=Pseudogulbenkiania ferrooxidans EGD-HP2 TaxID=1388764 RepID=A0ABP2XGP9_9NEIS|nr:hypothetical protein O166_16865 [Pseudogulbenkiania ferrooxidans EGD-HP2]
MLSGVKASARGKENARLRPGISINAINAYICACW